MREYSRAEYLALTPDHYLAGGYFDESGALRAELRSDYATAAATQFLAAGLPPQELGFTYEAVKALLPLQDGDAAERMHGALQESLETVARMIQQPNNEGLVKWLQDCLPSITAPADIDAFMEHFLAVLRQYTIFAASQPSEPSSPAP